MSNRIHLNKDRKRTLNMQPKYAPLVAEARNQQKKRTQPKARELRDVPQPRGPTASQIELFLQLLIDMHAGPIKIAVQLTHGIRHHTLRFYATLRHQQRLLFAKQGHVANAAQLTRMPSAFDAVHHLCTTSIETRAFRSSRRIRRAGNAEHGAGGFAMQQRKTQRAHHDSGANSDGKRAAHKELLEQSKTAVSKQSCS
jgi:hypothetical protein